MINYTYFNTLEDMGRSMEYSSASASSIIDDAWPAGRYLEFGLSNACH